MNFLIVDEICSFQFVDKMAVKSRQNDGRINDYRRNTMLPANAIILSAISISSKLTVAQSQSEFSFKMNLN
jgi:hypothetical protein